MNSYKILNSFILPTLLLLLLGCGSGKMVTDEPLSTEQQNIRQQLFQNIDSRLVALHDMQADLYSSENYESGKEHYDKADQYLRRDRNIDRIREELNNADKAFDKAEETSRIGEVTFRSTTDLRNKAIRANASEYTPDIWKDAEASFKKAAIELEGGSVNRTQREALKAEALYSEAELEAIKASFLNPARELLKKAADEKADKNAPKTIAKAKKLVKNVEGILEVDRYETAQSSRLAREAAYEASHGLYLHRTIIELKDDKQDFEDVFLDAQQPIRKIAETVNVEARFDKGFDGPADLVIEALQGQGHNEVTLERSINQYQQEIELLRGQLEEKNDLAEQIEGRRRRDESINKVINLFNPSQGNVFLDGNNVLIRLYGLSFPVGSSVIEAPNFFLLSRVQEAIRQYPDATITIEGHTDSSGGAQLNKRLSEDRAAAVSEYIRANIDIPIRLSAIGYGPDRPVASNETADGRSRNRRIDVVIKPRYN